MSSLQAVSLVLGITLAICTLVGLAVRFILVPYLRTNLVRPIAHVEQQVTAPEPDQDREPTLRDDVRDVHEDVRLTNRFLEAHVEWSQEWTTRVEKQVDALEERVGVLEEHPDHCEEVHADHERRLAALEAVWPPRPADSDT